MGQIFFLIFLQNLKSTELDCQCNAFGSTNKSCDQIDGQCYCKTGYEGIKCDKCAPGSHAFENSIKGETPNNGSQCSGKDHKTLHENYN